VQGESGPLYGGQIFIPTNRPLFQGAVNGSVQASSEDWIFYGASVLRHEKWHRDAPSKADRISEAKAYKEQESILRLFEGRFKSPSFYTKQINAVRTRMNKHVYEKSPIYFRIDSFVYIGSVRVWAGNEFGR
jgi:hypothetical protein